MYKKTDRKHSWNRAGIREEANNSPVLRKTGRISFFTRSISIFGGLRNFRLFHCPNLGLRDSPAFFYQEYAFLIEIGRGEIHFWTEKGPKLEERGQFLFICPLELPKSRKLGKIMEKGREEMVREGSKKNKSTQPQGGNDDCLSCNVALSQTRETQMNTTRQG